MKAIVFIDVQNDFLNGGKLAFGYPKEDNLQKLVDFANECIVDSSNKIYVTRDTHDKTLYVGMEHPLWQPLADWIHESGPTPGERPVVPMSGYLKTLEGQKLPVEHCIEGTNGWQVADKLMDILVGHATFVNKPTFGSYDLIDIISEDFEDAPEEIILCGYDLSICVLANAVLLRAKYPNTKIAVKIDLCGDVDKVAFDAAVKVLQMQQIDLA